MAQYSDAFSGRSACVLYIDINETSTNPATNESTVTFSMYIIGNSASFNGFTSSTGNLTVNGEVFNIAGWTYDFRSNNTKVLVGSTSRTIAHNANGSKSITVSGTATDGTGSPLGTATIGAQTLNLTDFVRVPSAPAAPTLSRSSDGTTITVVSAVASSAVSVTNYDMRHSTDNATWTTVAGIGTDRTGTFTGTSTSTYYVQTRAISSEGTGSWSSSSNIVGIPAAPSTIAATRTGRNVTVTAGTSSGSGITGYSVQYSTNAGSTWSAAQAMTSQAHTYTSLTAGQTYLFRVYSTNSIGNSAFTTSAAVFVPAGGRRYDGATFTPTTTAKRWDGSAWVDITTAKRWNGTTWTDLT